jgi:secondary thiamine-phosphate synthase enzyme
VNIQTRHTTTGLLVNEHEPLLLEDLTRFLERLAPRDTRYAHDELHRRTGVPPDERPNGHSHAKASLLRTAETLNVVGARLQLGRWQRVLLVELDGPRSREVSLVALGTGRRR